MLPGYIQASRALMITSIVLGTFGLLAGLLGIQCSKAGGDNLVLKGRIAGTGGVFFLLQGNTKHTKSVHSTLKKIIIHKLPAGVMQLFGSISSPLTVSLMIKECLTCAWPKHRFVHNDCSVLVRLQHHPGLLRPLLSWDKVRQRRSGLK